MPRRSEFKMRWRNVGTLTFLVVLSISYVYAIETNNQHAPSSNTVIHHPTASLSIAGDLKDVKLKASIAQLVRALQHQSKPSEPERRPKLELDAKNPNHSTLITKHTINIHGKDGRKLDYGAEIPAPITISSQAIQISAGSNKTGGKRSRSLTSVDSKGVKTIEGVRVPDDEHDKHYTWRNARVIKGFLVPNGRDPNPHKKRQVVITDPNAYLAAAAAAQVQGATTIIDPMQSQQSGRMTNPMVYSHSQNQPNLQQPQQVSQAQAHGIVYPQELGSTTVYHQSTGHTQQSQQQQPVHQYQSATSSQTTAFAYAPQQQGQMYVLQDGNTYVQYNPVQNGQIHQQPASQLSQSQNQFYSRSGELPSSSATAQTPQVQTVPATSDSQKQQELQIQQHLAQAQAAVQAFQEQNAKTQEQQQQQYHQALLQAQSAPSPSVQDNKIPQAQNQPQTLQEQSGATVLVPQGATVIQQGQEAQDFLAAAAAASGVQYIQVQGQSQQQGSVGATVYQLPGQNTFAERQAQVTYPAGSQNSFVIQPQTYVAGPGGQAFTIPIPVPADQAHQTSQRRDDNHQYQNHQHQQYQNHQHQQHHNQNQKQRTDFHQQQLHHHQQHQQNPHNKDKQNFANRVMQALQHNKKALDRMDTTTTAVVPALASTGIFLGLSALAAGWYLSKGNREVGIVRRTGKPAGGSSSQASLSRSRRDVGVPPNNYPQEVDQATFFQSIIQQSLEKTQQQYEDQVEPVYNREVQQSEPVYNREPEPERPSRPPKNARNGRPSRPHNSRNDDDDDYYSNSKVSKHTYAQDKSGAVTVASSKNFAKVFIPALIVGVSVVVITALIFGWYVTGANREIAFLEPASYSRRKRSLLGPTALSDGWLQRTITAIHGNPYDQNPPTAKSFLPNPFMDRETSKTSDLEFKISNTGLTGVLAGGAIIAIVALGLANSLSEAGNRQLKTGRANPSAYLPFNNNNNQLKHNRAPRGIQSTNDLTEGHIDNPGFLATILSNIQLEPNSIMSKFQEAAKWQETPCAKRIFCDMMTSQDDDTIRVMEKRMATFINMLPESMSKKLSHSFSDVVSSIYKKDCSAFTCGGHRVDSSNIHQPSSPVNQPR